MTSLLTMMNCYYSTKNVRKQHQIFPYWIYNRFLLDSALEDECLSKFRFCKADIPVLAEALIISRKFVSPNGRTSSAIKGLCILLCRVAYPCRLLDLIPRFGRSKSTLCLIFKEVMRYVSNTHGHLLSSVLQDWLQPNKLQEYAQAVFN